MAVLFVPAFGRRKRPFAQMKRTREMSEAGAFSKTPRTFRLFFFATFGRVTTRVSVSIALPFLAARTPAALAPSLHLLTETCFSPLEPPGCDAPLCEFPCCLICLPHLLPVP